MPSLVIHSGFSPQNSGRSSGNSTVNGLSPWHSFWSSTDWESWETVRKSSPCLSRIPTITAHLVRNHSFCGKNNWNKEFRKRQSYTVIVVLTLINLEKGKWKGLVLAFELGTLGKQRNEKVATSWFWGPNRSPTVRPGHKCGAPLLGPMELKESHHQHLGEECPLRSKAWGRQQRKAWVGGSLLSSCVTLYLFYKPGKLRPRLS